MSSYDSFGLKKNQQALISPCLCNIHAVKNYFYNKLICMYLFYIYVYILNFVFPQPKRFKILHEREILLVNVNNLGVSGHNYRGH